LWHGYGKRVLYSVGYPFINIDYDNFRMYTMKEIKRIFIWTKRNIIKMDIYDGSKNKEIKLDTSKFPNIPESNDFIIRIKKIIDDKAKKITKYFRSVQC